MNNKRVLLLCGFLLFIFITLLGYINGRFNSLNKKIDELEYRRVNTVRHLQIGLEYLNNKINEANRKTFNNGR